MASSSIPSSFDTGLPSIRQLQTLIRDQKSVEVKVTTGDTLVGALTWQDANAICVKDADGQNTILMRGAIAYVKAGQ
jgi:host factor-I protein